MRKKKRQDHDVLIHQNSNSSLLIFNVAVNVNAISLENTILPILSQLETTMDIYTHITEETQNKEVTRLKILA